MENTLDRAYVCIEDGNLQSATNILETLVRDDPVNVEAWEAYMQICDTCEGLDLLCDRVLQVPEINQMDRDSVLDYYYFLRQRMIYRSLSLELQNNITFELMDQFTFRMKNRGEKHKLSFVRYLKKAVFIQYLILLVAGACLLLKNNNFGYWILVVLAMNAYIYIQKKDVVVDVLKRKISVHQSIHSGLRRHEIEFHPKILPWDWNGAFKYLVSHLSKSRKVL